MVRGPFPVNTSLVNLSYSLRVSFCPFPCSLTHAKSTIRTQAITGLSARVEIGRCRRLLLATGRTPFFGSLWGPGRNRKAASFAQNGNRTKEPFDLLYGVLEFGFNCGRNSSLFFHCSAPAKIFIMHGRRSQLAQLLWTFSRKDPHGWNRQGPCCTPAVSLPDGGSEK
jgi:hypothetical protein